ERGPRAAAHSREQWTERGVGRRHFAEIRSIRILTIVRRRWPIGRVRLVDVDPGEPPTAGLRVDPRRGQRDDRGRWPLDNREATPGESGEAPVGDVEP